MLLSVAHRISCRWYMRFCVCKSSIHLRGYIPTINVVDSHLKFWSNMQTICIWIQDNHRPDVLTGPPYSGVSKRFRPLSKMILLWMEDEVVFQGCPIMLALLCVTGIPELTRLQNRSKGCVGRRAV